jgi:hypothetical protein
MSGYRSDPPRRSGRRAPLARKRRRGAGPMIAVLLGIVIIVSGVAVIGFALRSNRQGNAAPDPSPSVEASTDSSGEPLETVTEDPSAAASPKPAGPRTTFEDGIWLVGKDIKPGRYQAKVPADVFSCHWVRMKSTDAATLDSMIEEKLVEPGATATVTIKSTDKVFKTELCGTWKPA